MCYSITGGCGRWALFAGGVGGTGGDALSLLSMLEAVEGGLSFGVKQIKRVSTSLHVYILFIAVVVSRDVMKVRGSWSVGDSTRELAVAASNCSKL